MRRLRYPRPYGKRIVPGRMESLCCYAVSPLHLEHKAGTIKYGLLVLLQAVGSHYCLFTHVE